MSARYQRAGASGSTMSPSTYTGSAALPVVRPGLASPDLAGRRVVVDRVPAADDTDTSTLQTVRKMCEYVRDAIADPQVRKAAAYAQKHFAKGSTKPEALAWAVFWYVKHCVRFRQDEATMFRVGARGEFDLLIAPAVLVRMKDPAEDCDGFTMLCWALLSILGVPSYCATVAVDLDDPERWSHVFVVADLPSGVMPIDASHGSRPGWMVPRSRINRWQCWNLEAEPVDVRPMRHQGLHGYVRDGAPLAAARRPRSWRRGVGDDLDFSWLTGGGTQGPTGPSDFASPYDWAMWNGADAGGSSSFFGSGSGSGSSNWGNFFANLVGQASSVARVALAPPAYSSVVRDPVTGQIISSVQSQYPTGSALGSSSSSSLLLLGGGALLLLVFAMKK